MTQKQPDPSAIMQLATGYWNSAAMLAASELGVFGALAAGPQSVRAISERLALPLRSLALLLDACVGLGLLEKWEAEGESQYRNTSDTAVFLVPGSPAYLGDAIGWSADQYPLWGQLSRSVRQDGPAANPALHLGDDPEQTRRFVLGMHNRARGIARVVVAFLNMSGVETLLDVGGGPGTYAVLLAKANPTLRVTLLELPAVAAIADELIALAEVGGRVRTRAGDATTADYGAGEFDAVLFSGVLHQMSAPTIREMLGKAHRTLKPGGRVLISDIMLDATKTQPTFAALFSLQMLLTQDAGAVFSVEECRSWLSEAGFTNIAAQKLPEPLPYVVVTAEA